MPKKLHEGDFVIYNQIGQTVVGLIEQVHSQDRVEVTYIWNGHQGQHVVPMSVFKSGRATKKQVVSALQRERDRLGEPWYDNPYHWAFNTRKAYYLDGVIRNLANVGGVLDSTDADEFKHKVEEPITGRYVVRGTYARDARPEGADSWDYEAIQAIPAYKFSEEIVGKILATFAYRGFGCITPIPLAPEAELPPVTYIVHAIPNSIPRDLRQCLQSDTRFIIRTNLRQKGKEILICEAFPREKLGPLGKPHYL